MTSDASEFTPGPRNKSSPKDPDLIVFALLGEGLGALPKLLRHSFQHPWVASYQIGFGPPLVRATQRLRERVRTCRSALEKLDVYLEHCVLDRPERIRLEQLHRRLMTRLMGPVEAEQIDRAYQDALDLTLRLFAPGDGPQRVRDSMHAEGVFGDHVESPDTLDDLTGRFVVRLDDVENRRFLELPQVSSVLEGYSLALELRVSVRYRDLWRRFLNDLCHSRPFRWVDVGRPPPHARVRRDGLTE